MRKAKYRVELNESERNELSQIARQGQGKARIMRRAQILLWSADGKNDLEIAALLDISPYAVAQTRERWVKDHRLDDQPRPGRRPKTDGKQDAFLVALACSAAPEGRETWTMQLLAERWVELGVVTEPISDETVRRRLKKMNSNPG
jgi:transposase